MPRADHQELRQQGLGKLAHITERQRKSYAPDYQREIVEYLFVNAKYQTLHRHLSGIVTRRIGEEDIVVRERCRELYKRKRKRTTNKR